MRIISYLVVTLGVLLFTVPTSPVFAESAEDIIKKANLASYYAGKDGTSQMLMKVYSKNRKKPLKKMFYMLKKDRTDGGEQFFLIKFTKPTDINRTTFLVHKKIGEDDMRRLYIPASDKILAISGSRKQDPFMGSDFSYEDVSGRHYLIDNHKLLGEEKLDGKSSYVIESVPKVREAKTSKIKSWILTENYMPIQVEFYDHDGEIYKIYKGEGMKLVQGIPTTMKRTMTSPLEGTETVILLNPKKVKYDVGLKDEIFTERSLRNPPNQYFK